MRRLMLPPFHGERLRALGDVVAARAGTAVERWPAGRPVALLGALQRLALDVALEVVLGADGAALAGPVRATLDRVGSGPRVAAMALVPRDLGPRSPWGAFLRDVRAVDEALGAVIARRRAATGPRGAAGAGGRPRDVLRDLLDARDADGAPLGDREVRDHVVTLLAAGHETTAGAGAWALERLARGPAGADAAARIRAGDDAMLDAVVHETLRVRPVLTVAPRRLAEPLVVDGRRLPAGVHVAPCLYLVGRHPAVWGPDAGTNCGSCRPELRGAAARLAAARGGVMQAFPLFMSLQGRGALVVGGTEAAARKVELLSLLAGAQVTLIADTACGARLPS